MPRKSNSDSLKSAIHANAAEITRLRSRIDDTFKERDKSAEKREEWKRACADFHLRYQALAFPGGERSAAARILAGDVEAVEAALCFVELRPYFVRSGYMYQEFLRKLNRAPLSQEQAARLSSVKEAYHAWKVAKRKAWA